MCSAYARHPAIFTALSYTAIHLLPVRGGENGKASSMTRDGKQIHEYEGRMDEYGERSTLV
jgi:hypothetical protein